MSLLMAPQGYHHDERFVRSGNRNVIYQSMKYAPGDAYTSPIMVMPSQLLVHKKLAGHLYNE